MHGLEVPAWEERSRSMRERAWTLTLLAAQEHVDVLLSDGLDRFVAGRSARPAAGEVPVLPEAVRTMLAQDRLRRMRLQLPVALDAADWETALERVRSGLVVSRHLGGGGEADAPPVESLGSDSRDDALWLHGPTGCVTASALRARTEGRALLVVAEDVPTDTARRFRGSVRQGWREPQWFAQAAARAAAALGLPRAMWRVYGDTQFVAAAEGEERRRVAALSFDVVGSTALMHAWGEERYARQHAELHRRCRLEVHSRGGRLDEPRGNDGWMAYFGLASPHGDAAADAVLAAEAVTRLAPGLGFALRAGVASGRLALRHGDVFGPEVHLAARLRALAPPGGVVISGEVEALLGPGVEREPIGPQSLHGFAEPQPAFLLHGVTAPRFAARPRALDAPLVGRQRELAALVQAWRQAREDRCAAWVCIVGEPGIGKTRLLREFEHLLREAAPTAQPVLLYGRRALQASAFAALAAGLQGETLGPLAAPLRQQGERLTGNEPDSALQRQRLLDGLVDGFLALARTAPLCVIVDDAQWLDPSTLEFIERLRSAGAAAPLLIVVGLRDDARSLACGVPTEPALRLGALDREESLQLLGSLPSARRLDDALRQRIAERAGGIPLYLEETVRMVEASTDAAALAEHAIPATLDELLTARLEVLGAARPLAQLAAVLGVEFPASLWEAVRAEPDVGLARACGAGAWERVLASGLVAAEEGAAPPLLRFKHALIRDAAYESLWQHERRRLHGIVARVIERGVPGLPAALQRRAEHLAAAGELQAAAAAWTTAAQQAAGAAADREALALAQRALGVLAQLPDSAALRQQALQLHLLQAARCIALDGYGAASVEAAYLRAAALCSDAQDPTMRTRVELGLEACYAMRGDLARARALAEAAVHATDWQPHLRLALQARWAWINVVFHQGHLEQALAMADACLARYEPSLHQPRTVQDPAIMCLCYSAWGLFERGCAGQALERVQRLLALAQRLDHPFSHAVAHGFAASVRLFRGELSEGLAQAEEAVRRCSAGDFQAWLAHARVIRGRLWAAQGDARAGLAEMEAGLALWLDTGARITGATYLAFQAEACLMLGEPAEALGRLLQAHEIAQRLGEHYYEAELLRLQGWSRWLLRRGQTDVQEARALLQRSLALARAQGRLGFALRSALALGRLDAEHGEQDEAILRLEEALSAVPDHHGCADAREARQTLQVWHAMRRRTH